jgi:hypothetical protein
MAITPHATDALASFDNTLFAYLTPLEGDVHFVYSDQPLGKLGVPTLSTKPGSETGVKSSFVAHRLRTSP